MEKEGEDGKKLLSSTKTRDMFEPSVEQTQNDAVKCLDDPSVDWFEPLEEDWEEHEDAQSLDIDGARDAEMESLAGESEKSGSVAGSERNYKGRLGGTAVRRKRKWVCGSFDGWEDCPVLGEGWKRKVVLRRSGLSVGQRDVYYLSPKGERVRSKIELLKYIGNTVDLTNFDFKTGTFQGNERPKRGAKRKKLDYSSPAECGFSSESSFQNEATEASDRTYSPGPTYSLSHTAVQRLSPSSTQKEVPTVPSPGTSNENPNQALQIQPASPTKQNAPVRTGFLLQTLKVPAKQADEPSSVSLNSCVGVCCRCRNPFTVKEDHYMCDQCVKACRASKDNRKITFRKWLPCGFCEACQLTEDCGVCANCRNLNRRPIRCQKRKCLRPSLKLPVAQCGSVVHIPESLETTNTASKPSLPDFKESQYSDSDEQSPSGEENDSEGLLRKFRRSCGQCKGCVAKADCGTCDYCIDKPKFGGSNKKRQKCRRRQCQTESKGWITSGRSKPQYVYSHNVLRQNNEKSEFEYSENECERERNAKGSVGVRHVEKDKPFITNYNGQNAESEANQALSDDHLLHLFCDEWSRVKDRKLRCSPEDTDEDDMEPTITQIFSLGGDLVDDGLDLELLELLASLRDAPLPVLWCAVLAEGPRLQLLQCSKLSAMVDTTVQIEPSFRYHISVQGQPLLPTHWLYHAHPAQLTSVEQITTLLEDLERYSVCRGFKSEPSSSSDPIVQIRAATCEFLVLPETQCCARCKSAQQKQ